MPAWNKPRANISFSFQQIRANIYLLVNFHRFEFFQTIDTAREPGGTKEAHLRREQQPGYVVQQTISNTSGTPPVNLYFQKYRSYQSLFFVVNHTSAHLSRTLNRLTISPLVRRKWLIPLGLTSRPEKRIFKAVPTPWTWRKKKQNKTEQTENMKNVIRICSKFTWTFCMRFRVQNALCPTSHGC